MIWVTVIICATLFLTVHTILDAVDDWVRMYWDHNPLPEEQND